LFLLGNKRTSLSADPDPEKKESMDPMETGGHMGLKALFYKLAFERILHPLSTAVP